MSFDDLQKIDKIQLLVEPVLDDRRRLSRLIFGGVSVPPAADGVSADGSAAGAAWLSGCG